MVTAVIVDDEKKSREVLKRLIEESQVDVIVLGEASSVEEGVEVINKELPQLVFLDVEMLDGTGFNLLEKFDKVEFKVIFTTAYDKYAIKAFKYSAIDYLLKPIDIEELENAVVKAKNSMDIEMFNDAQIKVLLNNIKEEETNKRITITSASRMDFVNLNEVVCCRANGSYTEVLLLNNKKIMASKPLKHFDTMFTDSPNFIRVSKSHIISLKHVTSYKKDTDVIVLEDGIEVDLSRRRKKEFLKML
ncbi:MAG: response regulator transcription factor [Vicingus serpentipes]|nr:response regulator transcription factor [Vicingus serpentipes]